ncbi:MAG: bactofilin family protein [Hyphomicrobium sp.]
MSTFIGLDLTISGNLVSSGKVQVEGEVQGDVRGRDVTVGEKALVSGGIVAEEVTVGGTVQGSIRGQHVKLLSTARFEGDVYYKLLGLMSGAHFEGKSQRVDDPLAPAAKPDMPASAVMPPARPPAP